MFVLITGQYGTKHNMVVNALVKEVEKIHGKCDQFGSPIITYESIEETIKKERIEEDLPAFFNLPTDFTRQAMWDDAAKTIKVKFDKTKFNHKILSLHTVYYWEGRFFSLVNWELLLSFSPTVIVTLIDDIYDIWGRIKDEQTSGITGIPEGEYSLPVILSWREREIFQSSIIAKHLYLNPNYYPAAKTPNLPLELHHVFHPPIKHFIISIKQSVQTLYNLLFKRKRLPIYTSFPISSPRNTLNSSEEKDQNIAKEMFKKLNDWRSQLHSKFTVFDPLGIDELRYGEDYCLTPRIDFSVSPPMVPPITNVDLKITPDMLKTVDDQINYQIKERDFHLILQSQCVVMWRPFLWDKAHQGVQQEAKYAKATHKRVFSYHPPNDHVSKGPFPYEIGTYKSYEKEVIDLLEKYQKERESKVNSDTWECET